MTTTDTDALTKRIARAICEVDNVWERTTPEFRAEFDVYADAVLPIVAVEVRKAKAEALRELAELSHDSDKGIPFDSDYDVAIVGGWILDCATEYETGDQL